MTRRMRENALLLPVLLLSAASAAAGSQGEALQACSVAVAGSMAQTQGFEPEVSLDTSGIRSGWPLSSQTLFHLDVRDPATEEVVGRYDCFVDKRGRVERLRPLPLTAPSAKQRGRT